VHGSTFGESLRRHRLALGITQEELAERAGLSARALSDLERGAKQAPRSSTVRLLVDALQLTGDNAKAFRAAAVSRIDPPSEVVLADLPAPASSFVGRESAVSELAALLQHTRLITLTGAGGVGKTRLALEIAARCKSGFSDGVALIELAAITGPSLVAHVVCTALGVAPVPGVQPIQRLQSALRNRHTLLILDNCEHLLSACADVATQLLQTCAKVHILATSREALGLAAETAWLVPSLSLPSQQRSDSEAVRLFMQRAGAVNRTLQWTSLNLDSAAHICKRLDGIPLAIELAAAWADVQTPPEIAARLDAGTGFLQAQRGAAPRHRTLAATVDWSLDLLSAAERALFDRLSAFAGGFTLSAAEAVAEGDVLTSLAHLVKASLVLSESHGATTRFRMLEPVREIARTRLEASAEIAAPVHDRHADYFLSLAESVHGSLWGRRAIGGGIGIVEADLDNCRAALRWLLSQGDATRAGCLGAALGRFWLFSGRVAEGRTWFAALLPLHHAVDGVPARLLVGAAAAAVYEFDLVTARALLERSLAIARRAGDDFALAWALFLIAWGAQVAAEEPDIDRASSACVEGAAHARAASDPVLELMHDLCLVGLRLRAGDVASAATLAEDGLRRARTVGAPREVARALMFLGIAHYASGDLARAAELLDASRAEWEAEGETVEVPWFLVVTGLVVVSADTHDFGAARRYLSGLVELWSNHGRLAELGVACLHAFAYLAFAERAYLVASRTCAVIAAQPAVVDLLRCYGHSAAQLLARSGPVDVASSLEEMCAEALVYARSAPASNDGRGGLTPRELEVLHLMAKGQSNREIARALVLSDRTVAKHVDHIFRKANVKTRAAATAWAIRESLA
jgi:non-specific serine/threonine protein kinase